MKNIIPAFVIALALTGAVASGQGPVASAAIARPKANALPVPMCPPGDPNGCGISRGR